jgi:hypothetical protein
MEDLLDQVREAVDGIIVRSCAPRFNLANANDMNWQDFDGQRQAEFIATVLLVVSGVCHVHHLETCSAPLGSC